MTDNREALEIMPNRPPDQIGFVVHNLTTSVATWGVALGRHDWRVHTYGPANVDELHFRGESSNLSMRLAMCGQAPQVELIESLRGPNVYTEWTGLHGFGLQHIGYFIPSIREVVENMSALGLEPSQSGHGYGLDGDGGFAYYDIPGIDVMVEFIEVPRRRRPSEALDRTNPLLRGD